MTIIRIGLLTSVGQTLDAFFPQIVEAWEREGNVVFPASGTPPEMFPNPAVLPAITRQPSHKNIKSRYQLRNWIRRAGLDVVLTSTATASALVRLASPSVPVIYFCHGLHWATGALSLQSLPWRVVERGLLRRTSGVVVLNSDDAAWFAGQGRKMPILHLERGIGLDLARFPRSPVPSKPKRLAWVGEFSERKNPMAAVRTVAQLADSDVELVMLGDGPLFEQTEQLARDLGVDGRVRLVGRADPVPYLSSSSAVLHTALWEGLPRALLEAAAIGRPICAFDSKGVRDCPGVLLASVGDCAALARLADWACAFPHQVAMPDPKELSYERAAESLLAFMSQFA